MTITFYIIAFVLAVVIGFYQFYRVGGFRFVLQVAIIILIISYVAFGPYSVYYRQVKDQVKDAGFIAYRTVSNAFYDLWLLVTNPTEWYARQQALNVRPERPVDFPKGVELISFESLPPAVAGGQAFALTAVVRNDGPLTAKDIIVRYGCDLWCSSSDAYPSDYDKDSSLGGNYLIREKMERGESTIITVSPFVAKYVAGREAETNFARVFFNLSYTYSTNSSLKLTITDEDELQRRFREGDPVFRPVVAISKSTPAQLSLNVGPQPLREGRDGVGENALLLVSVSNSRDNSKVVLPKGTQIIIRMPEFLAQPGSFDCGGFEPVASNRPDGTPEPAYRAGYYTIVYETEANKIEILPYEFRSIFSFLCNFKTPASVAGPSVTGIVVAEIPEYVFTLEQKKDIPVTPSLGVLFDPFDKTCREISDDTECNARATASSACYWEPGTRAPDSLIRGSSGCRSCGPPNVELRSCEKFSQSICESAGRRCGLRCEWDSMYVNPEGTFSNGRCVSEAGVTAVPGIAAAGSVVGIPTGLTQEMVETYLRRNAKGTMADQGRSFYKLGVDYNVDPAFAVAVAMHESAGGTSLNARERNNYFGITLSGRGTGFADFATPEAGILEFYRKIRDEYVNGPQKQDTIAEIGCAKTSDIITHCYPGNPENTGDNDTIKWLSSVPQYRQAVLNMVTVYPGSIMTRLSPNYGDRPADITASRVILHCTASNSLEGALTTLTDTTGRSRVPTQRVSAHYVVAQNGDVYNLVAEEKAAWHAGNDNYNSIGVEIVNDCRSTQYTSQQYATLHSLVTYLKNKYNIPASGVIGHSDVDMDKTDPDKLDWNRLPPNAHGGA